MTVIARDAVARDHLVYAWPLPIGSECEVSCGDDELVVMCPAWMVGDRLGPGHHHYRTPDPTRPVSVFFVSTISVDATFDMTTQFMIPATGQPVRLRATGAIQVRCSDPGLLIAQFVGLPFDAVNEGVLRSVSRSIERMLARLLTRRVVMAGTPAAVTDPAMLANIVEELIAYNPTAGAVFGIELIGVAQLVIGSDDGSSAFVILPNMDWQPAPEPPHTNGRGSNPEISMTSTAPGRPKPVTSSTSSSSSGEIQSGEISSKATKRHASVPPIDDDPSQAATSGEIVLKPKQPVLPPEVPPHGSHPPVEVPVPDEVTQPGVHTPVPGSLKMPETLTPPAGPRPRSSAPSIPPPIPAAAMRPTPQPSSSNATTLRGISVPDRLPPVPALPPLPAKPVVPTVSSPVAEERSSIMGIGMSHIGSGSVAGEIPIKIASGGRVLVPGPNGLMQSATVRQLLQGYYELEVGSSGETIWVPVSGVVPE